MSSSSTSLALSYAMALLLFVATFVSSNIDQDRAECADKVVGLATCLPYVGGEAKAPTPDCCSSLKLVIQSSKKCLCVLIKDRNDPSLGLKVNLPLALGLPTVCHAPADVKDCVVLLHLPPNSQEAKDFLGLTTNGGGANTTAAGPAAAVNDNSTQNPQGKNDGGMRTNSEWLGVKIFVWLFTSSLVLTCIW